MKINRIISLFLFVGIMLISPLSLYSQINDIDNHKYKSTNRTTQFGFGSATFHDSYLAPAMKYSGLGVSIFSEKIGPISFLSDKMFKQEKKQLFLSDLSNKSSNSTVYYGSVAYHYSLFYPVVDVSSFRVDGGLSWGTMVGIANHQKNMNNPVSLKLDTSIKLSMLCRFYWNNFAFRWQPSLPIVGLFFAPNHLQSYYEIFALKNIDGVILAGTFKNKIAIDNLFTVDYMFKSCSLRLGYLNDYLQTRAHDIETKLISHQFLVGLVWETIALGGRKTKTNNLMKSCYYRE